MSDVQQHMTPKALHSDALVDGDTQGRATGKITNVEAVGPVLIVSVLCHCEVSDTLYTPGGHRSWAPRYHLHS